MPIAAANPELRSMNVDPEIGAGAPKSSTFASIAISPLYAWATMSEPARVANGPLSPKPVMFA